MEISVEKQYIGFWGIFFITLAGIANPISIALLSSAGYASVIIFIIAGILFFIPCTLVATELATSYPSEKGVYDWTNKAFGPSMGTLMVWCQNIGQLISMPVIFGFTLSCLAYGIGMPELAMSKIFISIGCLIGIWAMVGINLIGLKSSVRAAATASFFIYIVPISVLTFFIIYWLISGQTLATSITMQNTFINGGIFSNASLLVVAIFMLAGITLPAYFANFVKKTSTYASAMVLASVVLLAAPIIGCVAILFVIPVEHINDQLGLLNALLIYFSNLFGHNIGIWFEKIIMWMFFIGQLCVVSTIFLVASRGMMALAISGMLPKRMAKTNSRNVSVISVVWLGIISTVCVFLYILIPSLTAAFAVISIIFSIAAALQYLILFAAYVKLKKMNISINKNGFKIKNKFVAYIFCVGLGSLCILLALAFSFIPSSAAASMSILTYETVIIIGCIITLGLPILILKLRQNKNG